ncbi:hypothetical protein CERSUDRAFT_126818 [Gelatoporia subvermispora B]|uniref:Uncharacterized protein n=1 Tax=Ceriporiopsis subvermispora (strain B) TaxID=914234 RepID=M2QJY6_CERS8|nr:hypothetical protein CERSUDRAFT_126818 [Gelatoporia subvermispora B]
MDFTPRPPSVLPLWDQVRSRARGCTNPMGAAVRGEDGSGLKVLCALTRRWQIRVGGVGLPQRHMLAHDFAGCRPWQVAKFGGGGRGGHCSIRSQPVNALQENMSADGPHASRAPSYTPRQRGCPSSSDVHSGSRTASHLSMRSGLGRLQSRETVVCSSHLTYVGRSRASGQVRSGSASTSAGSFGPRICVDFARSRAGDGGVDLHRPAQTRSGDNGNGNIARGQGGEDSGGSSVVMKTLRGRRRHNHESGGKLSHTVKVAFALDGRRTRQRAVGCHAVARQCRHVAGSVVAAVTGLVSSPAGRPERESAIAGKCDSCTCSASARCTQVLTGRLAWDPRLGFASCTAEVRLAANAQGAWSHNKLMTKEDSKGATYCRYYGYCGYPDIQVSGYCGCSHRQKRGGGDAHGVASGLPMYAISFQSNESSEKPMLLWYLPGVHHHIHLPVSSRLEHCQEHAPEQHVDHLQRTSSSVRGCAGMCDKEGRRRTRFSRAIQHPCRSSTPTPILGCTPLTHVNVLQHWILIQVWPPRLYYNLSTPVVNMLCLS